MTDRLVLQRLESYQSDAGGGAGDSLNQPSSSSSIKTSKRSLFAQFSLIGDNDYDEEDTSIEENLTNPARRKGCWLWCIMMHYKRLGLAIVLFLCMAIILMWVSTKNKQTTDIKEHNNMSCPIQSSYSVSSDIMNLKNSSTGEYLYMHSILYHILIKITYQPTIILHILSPPQLKICIMEQ